MIKASGPPNAITCQVPLEQLAIDCKFFYVSIISMNNSQCRFFTVHEVQLILMYYLYVSWVFST